MKAEQVDQALSQMFVTEGARLVFWHDPNGEFADYVGDGLAGDLSDVHVLDVAEVGGLSAKLHLERGDRTGKYLVYSKGQVPPAGQDWLLDAGLYSAQFHADMASIWLQELGLSNLSRRPDHEGLHGIRLFRALPRVPQCLCVHGVRRQHRQRKDAPQDEPSALQESVYYSM